MSFLCVRLFILFIFVSHSDWYSSFPINIFGCIHWITKTETLRKMGGSSSNSQKETMIKDIGQWWLLLLARKMGKKSTCKEGIELNLKHALMGFGHMCTMLCWETWGQGQKRHTVENDWPAQKHLQHSDYNFHVHTVNFLRIDIKSLLS